MQSMDLLIKNASELVTVAGNNQGPRIKGDMSSLGIIEGGCVAVSGMKICATGTMEQIDDKIEVSSDTKIIDAQGKTVMPGFVDPHTHLIFSGSREFELDLKLQGVTYLEILNEGGGILRTVNETRKASSQDLFTQAKKRLDNMLRFGTTTVEAKSGYGLELEAEIKSLEVIKSLQDEHAVDLVPTFLGAHAVPPEYRDKTDDYVDVVTQEMLPEVAEKRLAKFCDVFCEEGVFSIDQSKHILEKGKELGLRPKVHADEIVPLGGAGLAAEIKAISASHLVRSSDEDIRSMAESGVIGVLVPATPFALMETKYPQARDMINAGLPLALATDLNPNCYCESMQFVISLACYNMKMLPSEAIVASTINAAFAIDKAESVGSLEAGKCADIIILDCPNHMHIPYRFGVNLVETVIKNGKVVVG